MMQLSQNPPINVRAVRPCWVGGKPVEVGSEHELPAEQAKIAIATGRMEAVQADSNPFPR